MESFDSLGGLLAEALNLSAGFDSSDDDIRLQAPPARTIRTAEDIAALRRELELEGSTFLHDEDQALAEESQVFRQQLGKLYRPPLGRSQQQHSSATSRFASAATSIVGIDESDIENSLVSMGAEELYQQLNDLEAESDRMQSIYSSQRRYSLQPQHALFLDVESGGSEITIDFVLPQAIQSQEVLTFRMFCIPNYAFEEDFLACKQRRRVLGEDFLPLAVRLTYDGLAGEEPEHRGNNDSDSISSLGKLDKPIPLEASLFNGEYCASLTNARHELNAGRYSLHIKIAEDSEDPLHSNYGRQTQGVQLSYQVYPLVSAKAVSAQSTVRDSVARNEFKYYRFVSTDPTKRIVIHVSPLPVEVEGESQEASSWQHDRRTEHSLLPFDVNLYLTNQFDALVPVTKDNAQWVSYDCHGHCLEIYPGDMHLLNPPGHSANRSYLQSFVLGVYGNNCVDSAARESQFALDVQLLSVETDTVHHYHIHPDGNHSGHRLSSSSAAMVGADYQLHRYHALPAHRLSHHCVDVDPSEGGKVLVLIRIPDDTRSKEEKLQTRFANIDEALASYNIATKRGFGIYGTQTSPFDLYPALTNTTTVHCETPEGEAVRRALRVKTYFTVVYVSATCVHPGPHSYQWKLTGAADTCFLLNSSEWKYLSNKAYFSVYIAEIDGFVLLQCCAEALQQVDPVDWIIQQKGVLRTGGRAGSPDGHFVSSASEDTTEDVVEEMQCHIWRVPNEVTSSKDALFNAVFQHIDGSKLTYRDREGVDFSAFPFEPLCPHGHHNYRMLHALQHSNSNNNASGLGLNTSRSSNAAAVEVDDYSLTYSEVDFASMRQLLHAVEAVDGEVLYDLGSGVGKALVGAALSGVNLLKVVGIELLPSLATCCEEVLQSLEQHGKGAKSSHTGNNKNNNNEDMSPMRSPTAGHMQRALFRSPQQPNNNQNNVNDSLLAFLTNQQPDYRDNGDDDMSLASLLTQSTNCSYQIAHIPDLHNRLQEERISLPIMEVRNENFLQSDWSEADIVFVSSLCFSDDLLGAILQQGRRLKKGAKLVTAKLPEKYEVFFDLKTSTRLTLSCGLTNFHVLIRNSNNNSSSSYSGVGGSASKKSPSKQ